MSRVLLLVAGNESWPPIGYLGLGGEVAALSDFVLAGVQIQSLVLQNLAIYNINLMNTAQFPIKSSSWIESSILAKVFLQVNVLPNGYY
jgi:hypothetical protein